MEKQHTTRASLMWQVKDADMQLCLEHNIDHSTSWQPTSTPKFAHMIKKKVRNVTFLLLYVFFKKRGTRHTLFLCPVKIYLIFTANVFILNYHSSKIIKLSLFRLM